MSEGKTKDPIPEEFASIAEAGAFWDTHSLADYWDETQEVEIDVRIPRERRVTLASDLAQQIARRAEREGVSVETLVNLWLSERLQAAP